MEDILKKYGGWIESGKSEKIKYFSYLPLRHKLYYFILVEKENK
ncbi:hypothetical protein [Spiroplasma poulsonii]|nr:hypothetical protein [Spiroplasma poulsonii]